MDWWLTIIVVFLTGGAGATIVPALRTYNGIAML